MPGVDRKTSSIVVCYGGESVPRLTLCVFGKLYSTCLFFILGTYSYTSKLYSLFHCFCHTETVYTFGIQKMYEMYTLIYTKCIQTVYKMYTTFRQTFVYILYKKSKKLYQLNFAYKMSANVCWNVEYILYTNMLYTFCIHFVCKMYTRVCRNMGYILHSNILYTFFIYQFWSTKSAHHKHDV